MVNTEELKKLIRRNMHLGRWAAEKLGLVGEAADSYAKDLAVGTLDAEGRDVLGKIRNDFEKAGIVQSDEQILQVVNEMALQVGEKTLAENNTGDAAAILIAQNLSRRP